MITLQEPDTHGGIKYIERGLKFSKSLKLIILEYIQEMLSPDAYFFKL